MEAILTEPALPVPLFLSRFNLVPLGSTIMTGVVPQKLSYKDMETSSDDIQAWTRLMSQKPSYSDKAVKLPVP